MDSCQNKGAVKRQKPKQNNTNDRVPAPLSPMLSSKVNIFLMKCPIFYRDRQP